MTKVYCAAGNIFNWGGSSGCMGAQLAAGCCGWCPSEQTVLGSVTCRNCLCYFFLYCSDVIISVTPH
jgi:hypothetical protein